MDDPHRALFHDQLCKDTIPSRLYEGITQPFRFSAPQCDHIESLVQDTIKLNNNDFKKLYTVDRGLLRNKYFFGERYTYGSQMQQKRAGMERLYPLGLIDPIPYWMQSHVIKPLTEANVIQADFVNSAVINEYQRGGCIVSHIDPPHIFDRPIISVNLNSDSALCFGCKFDFKPIRCSEPVLKLPLPRGIVTLLSGFAADEITHCVRPEDTKSYRTVIILRRVLTDAPRLLRSNLAQNVDISNITCTNKGGLKELDGETFKKFYEKFSKSSRGKRNHGGISKPVFARKTFFADNKRYANKPYSLE